MNHTTINASGKVATGRLAMTRSAMHLAVLLALIAAAALPGSSQSNPDLQKFFREDIGLNDDQIAAIQNGQPVTKTLHSRTPAEVFLFGAVYIHAAPESYVKYAHDFARLRKLPGYLALGVFSSPPQLSDLKGFAFDNDDIQSLKNCKPGNCLIQMPASSMDDLHQSVDWSRADVSEQVNQLLQKTALQRMAAYQHDGNQALGVYNDKRDPTEVPKQFAYMLSYSKALPERLPDFYNYLLAYPEAKPANVEDTFYWARVKFGLKPTLRVVQILTMRGNPGDTVAYAIAEKQLYASHYFETALDLSFCVRGSNDPQQPGFYLIMAMGSEQAGLTGIKGSIVRKAAVGRSVSNLQNALANIRSTLEATR
ncbi:MAG TPA: hypothetical protein VK699_09995 [Terriglobales bacterium]|jgi:hypothetical protein|nr:hypothetical protein [Terriglobales bacterium]